MTPHPKVYNRCVPIVAYNVRDPVAYCRQMNVLLWALVNYPFFRKIWMPVGPYVDRIWQQIKR